MYTSSFTEVQIATTNPVVATGRSVSGPSPHSQKFHHEHSRIKSHQGRSLPGEIKFYVITETIPLDEVAARLLATLVRSTVNDMTDLIIL